MKTKLIIALILIGLLLLADFAKAQKVYVVKDENEANMTIHITRYLNEADLVVYRTDDPEQAESIGMWYFVDSKLKADWLIYYTTKEEADLNIIWTRKPEMAGYQPDKRQVHIIKN